MTISWWTLGIQTVNVVILIWLLGRFFWRPVAAVIEQRRTTAQRIVAEAEAKRSEATAALADIQRTRAGFAGEREAILTEAHAAAERERTTRLAEAEKEARSLEAAAKATIEKEKQAVDKEWAERASRLAVEIAGRLAARLDSPAVRSAFLDWLLKEIQALPVPARQAAATEGTTLEATSATALLPADQDRYRELISRALGAHPQIVFKADRALIAGLELQGPHFIVSNSWRADLTQILTDLTHDNRL
jgi:F-type H+-transporting ATPase subunit b